MKVAVIGAGFAGLAASWYLCQEGCQVVVFSHDGGASDVSSGLLHPYPGEQARRSQKADEAMAATSQLISVAESALNQSVCNRKGILRYASNPDQKENLIKRTQDFDDIERLDDELFFIRSGMTIFPHLYLKGLTQACKNKGVVFYPVKIDSLEGLKDFDLIILACGAGIAQFPEASSLNLKFLKGQVLKCKKNFSMEKSIIGKGYVAIGETEDICYVGATYERSFTDVGPNENQTREDLFPKVRSFFPKVDELTILECRSALRVTRSGNYLPLIEKINEKIWVLTAFGSRGLLYHAFYAKQLSEINIKLPV